MAAVAQEDYGKIRETFFCLADFMRAPSYMSFEKDPLLQSPYFVQLADDKFRNKIAAERPVLPVEQQPDPIDRLYVSAAVPPSPPRQSDPMPVAATDENIPKLEPIPTQQIVEEIPIVDDDDKQPSTVEPVKQPQEMIVASEAVSDTKNLATWMDPNRMARLVEIYRAADSSDSTPTNAASSMDSVILGEPCDVCKDTPNPEACSHKSEELATWIAPRQTVRLKKLYDAMDASNIAPTNAISSKDSDGNTPVILSLPCDVCKAMPNPEDRAQAITVEAKDAPPQPIVGAQESKMVEDAVKEPICVESEEEDIPESASSEEEEEEEQQPGDAGKPKPDVAAKFIDDACSDDSLIDENDKDGSDKEDWDEYDLGDPFIDNGPIVDVVDSDDDVKATDHHEEEKGRSLEINGSRLDAVERRTRTTTKNPIRTVIGKLDVDEMERQVTLEAEERAKLAEKKAAAAEEEDATTTSDDKTYLEQANKKARKKRRVEAEQKVIQDEKSSDDATEKKRKRDRKKSSSLAKKLRDADAETEQQRATNDDENHGAETYMPFGIFKKICMLAVLHGAIRSEYQSAEAVKKILASYWNDPGKQLSQYRDSINKKCQKLTEILDGIIESLIAGDGKSLRTISPAPSPLMATNGARVSSASATIGYCAMKVLMDMATDATMLTCYVIKPDSVGGGEQQSSGGGGPTSLESFGDCLVASVTPKVSLKVHDSVIVHFEDMQNAASNTACVVVPEWLAGLLYRAHAVQRIDSWAQTAPIIKSWISRNRGAIRKRSKGPDDIESELMKDFARLWTRWKELFADLYSYRG